MGKWDEHDPLYDDMNLSENKEIKKSIKKVVMDESLEEKGDKKEKTKGFMKYLQVGYKMLFGKDKITFISLDFVKGYLDGCIIKWRKNLKKAKTEEDKLIAKCNVDTFQSVRVSLLGELLPKEKK